MKQKSKETSDFQIYISFKYIYLFSNNPYIFKQLIIMLTIRFEYNIESAIVFAILEK